jgi:CrcB protein
MSLALWIGVAVLGGAGAVARFVVTELVTLRLGDRFPFGTLVVNLTGAFLLGLLVGVAAGEDVLLLAGVGVLGGYTTFSTWMLETQRLDEHGARAGALANIVVSVAAGVGAVALGRLLGGG